VVAVALLVLVGIAPMLAGLGPVRRYVEGKIGDALGRPVALGELEAGWTKGVAIRGLSVANRGAEFGDEALVEIASVSVTDPLTQLVFGGGPTRIVIDGLVVRVEEQAGGRTNVDDILERFAAPKPPPEPEVEPPPPTPLQLELRHCTFQFRRLPYRAPPRRVDPFVEDAVIRDAGEGALRLGIERFDLTVAGGLKRQTIRFAGGVAVNGKGGQVEGSIEIAGDDFSGEVKADDLDLELLQPFLPFDLRGKLDLEVGGDAKDGLDLSLRVEGLHLEGEKLPTVTEDWIDLSAAVRRTDDGVVVETLGLKTASGEVELEAGGSWPLAEGAPFHVRTRLPSRLLFAPTGKEPLRTTLHLKLEGTGTPDELDVAGKLSLPEVTFLEPELAKLGKGKGDLEFDVGIRSTWPARPPSTSRSSTTWSSRFSTCLRTRRSKGGCARPTWSCASTSGATRRSRPTPSWTACWSRVSSTRCCAANTWSCTSTRRSPGTATSWTCAGRSWATSGPSDASSV
jgi:hypothetical protein